MFIPFPQLFNSFPPPFNANCWMLEKSGNSHFLFYFGVEISSLFFRHLFNELSSSCSCYFSLHFKHEISFIFHHHWLHWQWKEMGKKVLKKSELGNGKVWWKFAEWPLSTRKNYQNFHEHLSQVSKAIDTRLSINQSIVISSEALELLTRIKWKCSWKMNDDYSKLFNF